MERLKKWGTRLSIIILICFWAFATNSNRDFEPVYSGSVYKSHLIVISIDALSSKDFEVLKNLPNFKKLIDNGSYAKEVTGVYPSLTYPSHTTIITGVYPYKHGVINNKIKQIGVKEQDWYWYSKDVKVPTLYDAANDRNMTVASFAWPVTAGANIKYNIPEIWSNNPAVNQFELLRKNGTSHLVNYLKDKYGKNVKGRRQPEFDDFISNSAAFIINSRTPNLVLIHLAELDSKKHAYGTDSEKVTEALKRQDERVGKIISAVEKAGIMSSTTFAITGDHGFLNINNKININEEFRKHGLIKMNSSGDIVSWKAFVNACDGSAYVYLKDNGDIITKAKVKEILEDLKIRKESGIENIFDKSDIYRLGSDRDAEYMLEAREGYYFSNDWQNNNLIEHSKAEGTHGYLPTKLGLSTVFIVSGYGVKTGVHLKSMNMIDEAPTFAKLLNVQLKGTDGKAVLDILK